MLDFDTEYDITRLESIVTYWFLVVVLSVLQLYVFAFLYGVFGFTLMAADEPIEDMEDEGMYYEFSKMGDSMLSELTGLELAVEDIDDYIQSTTEAPSLGSNNVADIRYHRRINRNLPTMHVINTKHIKYRDKTMSNKSVGSQLQYRMATSRSNDIVATYVHMKERLGESHKEVKNLRTKVISDIVMNNYLRNSYIALGIYPNTEFDFYILSEWIKHKKSPYEDYVPNPRRKIRF